MASTVEKLRLAGAAAPRFRDLRKRKIRTESGREIDTAQLGEALLHQAEIELAITEEVARRHCRDCKTLLANQGRSIRCRNCELNRRRNRFGLKCSCGAELQPHYVAHRRRHYGHACELRCKKCESELKPYRGPGTCKNCGRLLKTLGSKRPTLCQPCFQKNRKRHYQCSMCTTALTARQATKQRTNRGKDCKLFCLKCSQVQRCKNRKNKYLNTAPRDKLADHETSVRVGESPQM